MTPFVRCPSTLATGYSSYSPTAIKTLFDGVSVSPVLTFDGPSSEEREAKEAIRNQGRISLSGVQPKFSMVIGENNKLRYTREGEQGHYILKPAPTSYHIFEKSYCAANEHLTMQIASQVYGIETAPCAMIFFKNGEPAYLTRRFDLDGDQKLAQEDFASLLGLTKTNGGSEYKYANGSYEECAQIISRYVKAARIDVMRFFQLVLFNFITLNDDAHLKNFSLIHRGGEYRLTPAYDLMNTSLHLAEPRIFALDHGLFKEGMVMTDTHTVNRSDFEEFGLRIGLTERVIKRQLDFFATEQPKANELIKASFLSPNLQHLYQEGMKHRRNMLLP